MTQPWKSTVFVALLLDGGEVEELLGTLVMLDLPDLGEVLVWWVMPGRLGRLPVPQKISLPKRLAKKFKISLQLLLLLNSVAVSVTVTGGTTVVEVLVVSVIKVLVIVSSFPEESR